MSAYLHEAIALDLTLRVDAPDRHDAGVTEPAARGARLGPGNEVAAAGDISIAALTGRYGFGPELERDEATSEEGPLSACSLSSVGSQTILKSI